MYYFIINPNSRSGKGYKIWKRLQKQLDVRQVPYEAHLTDRPGHACEIAKQLTEDVQKKPKTIVVLGGDGTVNEVINGICLECPVTLGYIPAGSGNDLARSLKLPKKPLKAMKRILHPKYFKQLDYGLITYSDEQLRHRRFAVSGGIGFDAAVCHEILHSGIKCMLSKLRIEKVAYIVVGLKQLVKAKPSSGYLLLDGVKRVDLCHVLFISAHIHKYEGGGFLFAPKANPTDGLLDICVFGSSCKVKMIPVLLKALTGNMRHCHCVRYFQCREVEIHTEQPLAVHTDGESCLYQQDVDMRCIPRQIRIIV